MYQNCCRNREQPHAPAGDRQRRILLAHHPLAVTPKRRDGSPTAATTIEYQLLDLLKDAQQFLSRPRTQRKEVCDSVCVVAWRQVADGLGRSISNEIKGPTKAPKTLLNDWFRAPRPVRVVVRLALKLQSTTGQKMLSSIGSCLSCPFYTWLSVGNVFTSFPVSQGFSRHQYIFNKFHRFLFFRLPRTISYPSACHIFRFVLRHAASGTSISARQIFI